MAELLRRLLLVAVILVVLSPAAVSAAGRVVPAGEDGTVDPGPGSTVPGSTVPGSIVPDETEPEGTAPPTSLVGAGDPGGELEPAQVAIAIVGFLLLVGVAAWWMVRRDDPDTGPMPPERDDRFPPSDMI